MVDFDAGPSADMARHFAEVPDPPVAEDFWFDWGPVFYRGRLDGTARVMCLASDPGPTERIAGRYAESGRPDDNPESFKVRLDASNRQTAPLLPYYERQGKLVQVDGMGSIQEVAAAIDSALADA